jgi:ribosomal protein S18 acetylase RimI-like enzyme
MANQVVIRRPHSDELASVRALVRAVVNETFSELFAPNPVPLTLEEDDWSVSWVAVRGSKIVGVTLTQADSIGELWVLREYRRQGIGSRLLAQGQSEIAARGYGKSRLRVVKWNTIAVEFYLGRGWQIAREFPHEKYDYAMLELAKSNQAQIEPG